MIMTKYILHGGYTRQRNELNDKFFAEITKDVKENSKILLVYFATDESNYEEFSKQEKNNFLRNSKLKSLIFEIATKDNFIEQIKESDVIYIRGGDTFKLLNILKQFPAFSNAIQGKIVVGSSAGAYILSTYFYSREKKKVFEGLKILPIATHCHHEGNQKIVNLLKERGRDSELVLLADFEYQVISK